MYILADSDFDTAAMAVQPWMPRTPEEQQRQVVVQAVLARKAGATFGRNAYVAPDARIMTQRFALGDNSWVASGAIIRGNVEIGNHSSVNANAHIAGNVKIGKACRIAPLASIFGFNHGTEQADVPIKDQPITSRGIVLGDDVWVGANTVIIDGVEIGSHCIIAAGAVVTHSFPPYKVIGGNPARILKDRTPLARGSEPTAPAALAGVAAAAPELQVRPLLYATDPYTNLSPTFPPDLQGWDSQNAVFRTVIEARRPKLIVEVGTWKGASAIHMASICRELGLSTEIVCVDTWLGNWQHWSRKEGVGSRQDLRLVNGYPHLYYQFMSNVVSEGYSHIITPLPLTGVAGAKLFAHYRIRPDVIYIDGDHEYESVIWDLRGWLAVLAEDGILMGDDYNWPGVKRAADEVCADSRWQLQVVGNKFTIRGRA